MCMSLVIEAGLTTCLYSFSLFVLSQRREYDGAVMYDYDSLIKNCHTWEEEEKSQGIDIGVMMLKRLSPRLERDFFPKFQELGWRCTRGLNSINTLGEYDAFHHRFVTEFRSNIKNRNGTIISYGEAQQPINIFLKDYVDNIHSLGESVAERLRMYLHVTLDGVMIYYLQSFFRDDYAKHIAPFQDACGAFDNGRRVSFHRQDTSQSQLIQLLFIGKNTYYAWQAWFRRIFPSRPSLLDGIWSIGRRTLFVEGPYWTVPQVSDDKSLKGKILNFLTAGQDEVL